MPTTSSTDAYVRAAQKKFDVLIKIYSDQENFWRRGNSFDTLIDYVDHFAPVDKSCGEAVANVVVPYLKQYLPPNASGELNDKWFDDFGWWTIACQRALSKACFTAGDKKTFQDFTAECWSRFSQNAPYVWERAPDLLEGPPDILDTGPPERKVDWSPVVKGGVWNEYWWGTSKEKWPGPKDGDPKHRKSQVQGIQNTVTNALFLIAAHRTGDTNLAANAYSFLNAWFDPQMTNPLWWQPQGSATKALVRERVSHYTARADTEFQPCWFWTGDQGLIIGALVDRMHLMPAERAVQLDRVKKILAGSSKYLIDKETGVLNSWSQTGQVFSGYEDDYATGKGVFWRNVLYAWDNDHDLQTFLNGSECLQVLQTSAGAAALSVSETFDDLTNDIAVLVAAIEMLK